MKSDFDSTAQHFLELSKDAAKNGDYVKAIEFNENAQRLSMIPHGTTEGQNRGTWLWERFNIVCSVCGFAPYFDSTDPLYNYCPNCGAKMLK